MAQLQLSRQEAANAGLPLVCMQCGAPATNIHPVQFMEAVQFAEAAGDRDAVRRMTVNMPLCMDHRNQRPGVGTGIRAVAIAGDRITLTNVSEAFVRAFRRQDAGINPFSHAAAPSRNTAPFAEVSPSQPAEPQWAQLAESFTAGPSSQPFSAVPRPSAATPPKPRWGLLALLGGVALLPVLACGGCFALMLWIPQAQGPLAPAPQFDAVRQPQDGFGDLGIHDIMQKRHDDFDRQFREQQDRIRQQQEDSMRRNEELMKKVEEDLDKQLKQFSPDFEFK